MRLIDADKLEAHEQIAPLGNGMYESTFIVYKDDIDAQPTIDAVPVRQGKWIDEGQYADYHPHHAWRCSECGEHVIEVDTPWYKYCPNCGARMDTE